MQTEGLVAALLEEFASHCYTHATLDCMQNATLPTIRYYFTRRDDEVEVEGEHALPEVLLDGAQLVLRSETDRTDESGTSIVEIRGYGIIHGEWFSIPGNLLQLLLHTDPLTGKQLEASPGLEYHSEEDDIDISDLDDIMEEARFIAENAFFHRLEQEMDEFID